MKTGYRSYTGTILCGAFALMSTLKVTLEVSQPALANEKAHVAGAPLTVATERNNNQQALVTTNNTIAPLGDKRRLCNVISGTRNRPSYMGPLLNFSSWGKWRLGLFDPTADVYPTQLSSPLTGLYRFGQASIDSMPVDDPNLPDATDSGLNNSDKVESQLPHLRNQDEIPDTHGTGERGELQEVLSSLF
ncbi:MAG: hypothetical protein K8F91_11370, partial [Candidatus Obscuribacterales bacterium]|nr:hypothetical protein [Candidatus Obscuribacterales bacterium]